jgi:apolipoprotein N-acyltransferase
VKWSPGQRASTLAIYETLTRQAAPGRRLVVWPEAAVPAYLAFEPAIAAWLARLGAEVDVPILVGAPDAFVEGRATYYRNSAFLVERGGITRRYDKMQLVPFGEYVPLRDWLFFVRAIAAEIGEFSPGRQRVIFPLAGAPFGTVICYEVIFPDLFRRGVIAGAAFMANITNDAWFGETSGPWQHLGTVSLRAVENRVAIARAANTGVSAFVDPSGRVRRTLGLGERGVLADRLPLRQRETLYARWGDWFVYACLALVGATAGFTYFRRMAC